MSIIHTIIAKRTAIQTWDQSRKIKSQDILLAFFLNTYLLTRIIPMPSMLANLFAAMAGILCGVYVVLWKCTLPRYGCIGISALFCLCVLVSVFYNHNGSIYYVLWVAGFLSVAMLLYSCRLNPRFLLAQFYAFALLLALYAICGFSVKNVLAIGSENNISTYLILYYCVYLISRRFSNAPIALIPIGLAVVLTMWTGCRGGLLALGIMLMLALAYNAFYSSGKAQYAALWQRFKKSKWLKLFILVCVVVALVLVLTSDFFSLIVWKMTAYGGSSVRTKIWGEYILATFESAGNVLFGPDIHTTPYPTLAKYEGNPHNSFLSLHAHFGLIPFVIVVVSLIWAILWALKHRRYILIIVLLTAVSRSFFDWTSFPGPYDVLYYFAIICLQDIFPFNGGVGHKAMRYVQKPQEVAFVRADLGGYDVKLLKMVKRVYYWAATQIYNLSSPMKMTDILSLYDTPTMTKYHHLVSALRYVAVEEYYGQNDFGKALYINANNWESEEALQKDLEKFEALIKSIESRGYDSKSGIYVDLDGNCFNGTHRLALCAWFGIKQIPVVNVKRHLNNSTVSQLRESLHLSDEEYQQLEAAYGRMREKLLQQQ